MQTKTARARLAKLSAELDGRTSYARCDEIASEARRIDDRHYSMVSAKGLSWDLATEINALATAVVEKARASQAWILDCRKVAAPTARASGYEAELSIAATLNSLGRK